MNGRKPYHDIFTCGSLNVCGLRRRLLFPEVNELVQKYDIFCVTETKLDDLDLINISGYEFYSQTRKQKFLRKSGGMGVFIRKSLASYISIVQSDSDYVFWFRLNKRLTGTREDVIFGVVYIPPSASRFYNADETDLFEIELQSTCINNKYVVLMGDFNARTGTVPDISDADDFLMDHFDLQFTPHDLINISSLLLQLNMSVQRSSKDAVLTNEGKNLLDMCKSSNLCILNGRCGEDKDIRNFTFRNTSVIDYNIVSAEMLTYVENFDISDLDPLFTDGHSLLTSTLRFENICKTKTQKIADYIRKARANRSGAKIKPQV
ncbi:MAG: endonuclease/exonuclease/phosphatase family protein, partial [Candidatus Thiodiazotropha endolucinida]|nr:endonuclease/exonuclease/phosphatase family protein [Candidatus Thiodiazotropha taylori]MCW4262438.1 endonuclease/exonuclease/phosphatase family protein [Candidatus Thiodiazotropha endolucinida]